VIFRLETLCLPSKRTKAFDDIEASGAPSKTGTKVFMAIGALRGEHHSFMHDLESLFGLCFGSAFTGTGLAKKLENQNSKTGVIYPPRDSQETKLG